MIRLSRGHFGVVFPEAVLGPEDPLVPRFSAISAGFRSFSKRSYRRLRSAAGSCFHERRKIHASSCRIRWSSAVSQEAGVTGVPDDSGANNLPSRLCRLPKSVSLFRKIRQKIFCSSASVRVAFSRMKLHKKRDAL